MIATLSLSNQITDGAHLYAALTVRQWNELAIDDAPLLLAKGPDLGVGFIIIFDSLDSLRKQCGQDAHFIEILRNQESVDES